jgi:hypothetical protein
MKKPQKSQRVAATTLLIALALLGARVLMRHEPPGYPVVVPAQLLQRALALDEGAEGHPGSLTVLYVDETCPFCRGEIETLARMAEEGVIGTSLAVVLSPTSTPGNRSFIPEALEQRVIHDVDGAVGQALGVRRVPVTVFAERDGAIRRVVEGQMTSAGFLEEWHGFGKGGTP